MNTLLLTLDQWDLCLDAKGNIAMASNPYALAQDAASSIRLFSGEFWYDTTIGIPYFDQILGQVPPISLMKAYFVREAERVPEVTGAKAFISSVANRTVQGQVQITDATGTTSVADFLTGNNS